MKVTGSTIQQLERDKPRSRCRRWRIWATTDCGRKSERFNGTYKQAQERQRAWVSELEGAVPNAETFAAYAESWRLWRERSGGLGVQTALNDRHNVNALNRVLGGLRMDAITPEVVKSALMELRDGGSTRGKVLSGTTLHHLYVTLNCIMSTAAGDGRIASNPCGKVRAPKRDTKERRALTSAQMDAMWGNALPLARAGNACAMLVLLMLDAGLRPQEAVALAPEDVDLSSKRLHVRRAMKERTNTVGKTKRPASVRVLPMTDRLAEACREYSATRVGGPCFCEGGRDGGPLRMHNVRSWWNRHREELGAFEGMVPYELRHSNLTKMARYMSVFDLQRWAGWSSIGPAKVYVHADQSALEAAVRRSQMTASRDPIEIERTKNAPADESDMTA